MIYYELSTITDYTALVVFRNCNSQGVPYCLFRIGNKALFIGMFDLEENAQIVIPDGCKPKTVSVGGCVATGNVVMQPNQTYFVLVNSDKNLYFSSIVPARIMFTATWDV